VCRWKIKERNPQGASIFPEELRNSLTIYYISIRKHVKMIIEIKVPSPGESISEVEIASWLVQDGEYVEKDQEVAEVESDKATLPLIAGAAGTIKIISGVGETVPVGEVACTIDTSAKAPAARKKPAAEASDTPREPEAAPAKEESRTTLKGKPESTRDETNSNIRISPVAARMMEENGLSVDDIVSGLKRITKREVQMVMDQRDGSTLSAVKEASRDETRTRISNLRRKLAERLVAVKNQTAMLTTFNEADMSEIIRLRKTYQSAFVEKHGIKLGFMSFFVKAVTGALAAFPNVNSRIDGEEMVSPSYCDIGIAVQTDKGLMVPIVRNAETLSLASIESQILELANKARAARISMDDMTGGTFTITNGGVFGSLLSTPVLNPPQSAILGMHNIVERPVAVNGQVLIRPMMYIALSYDHRLIDGRDSVSFLVRIKELIENPVNMLFSTGEPDQTLLGL
jgi:2-oxoglutarate dehydrogenase E2 component (dihydrolipoamide succinyltransferase)